MRRASRWPEVSKVSKIERRRASRANLRCAQLGRAASRTELAGAEFAAGPRAPTCGARSSAARRAEPNLRGPSSASSVSFVPCAT